MLGLAAELGLAGVLFELSPFQSFRDGELARIRAAAEEKRLYLEFGMGSILHWHPMAEKGRQLLADAGYDMRVSDAKIVIEHLQVAQKLGSPILRCVAGNLFVRDEGHDMVAMADDGGRHPARGLPRRGRDGNENRHGEPCRFHGARAGFDPCAG